MILEWVYLNLTIWTLTNRDKNLSQHNLLLKSQLPQYRKLVSNHNSKLLLQFLFLKFKFLFLKKNQRLVILKLKLYKREMAILSFLDLKLLFTMLDVLLMLMVHLGQSLIHHMIEEHHSYSHWDRVKSLRDGNKVYYTCKEDNKLF